MPEKIIIATRESQLALWQAEHVKARLIALHPGLQVELLGMTTQGDQILDSPLSRIGGKGLFVKELEVAMEEGRADLAVHSIKDVPMDLPPGFEMAAILEREDPRDAFVSNTYASLEELPPNARVGTSSLRRQAQIRARLPHLHVDTLRGNVNTRLRKLDEGQYAAILLAAAGLKRLGFERPHPRHPASRGKPAGGRPGRHRHRNSQRSAGTGGLLAPLNHPETAACVRAERAMSRMLQGGCQAPIGGYAVVRDARIYLRAFVADLEGIRFFRATAEGALDAPEAVGHAAARELIEQGADHLMAEIIQRAR
jgi:hydroxymethylbilane synthase